MSVKFSNNGKTTLSSGVLSSATSIVVADASVFPSITGSEYFYMTLENVSGNVEILKVTSVSSNTLTAVRAQDGTSAISFEAGDKAENRLTAGGLNDVATQADTDTDTTYSVEDGGLTQKNFTTTLKTKLDGIEASADVTDTENVVAALTAGTNVAIAANGTISSTDTNTTYSVGDGGLTQKNFTTTLKTKLDGIAASANNYSLPFTDNSANWNTAYGWGDHSTEGYLTSFDITTQTDSKYLRSNASDTGTGVYTFSSNSQHPIKITGTHNEKIKLSGSASPHISFFNNSDERMTHSYSSTGYGQWRIHDGDNNIANLRLRPDGTLKLDVSQNIDGSVSNLYTNALVWHSGNDGASSGLDADKLDGQHGSYYLDYDNFTNKPSIPSLSGYATETYVDTAVSDLVDSSPSTLNTLNELAAALGDDANFSTTVTNSIGTKWTQDNTKISNWDTAYGWGDHSTEGYLTSYTDTNTTYSAGTGVTLTGTTFSLTDTNAKLSLAGGTMTGSIALSQNPVGTTYGNGVSTAPTDMISQVVGDNDGWRLYGEAPSSNDVTMVFEVIDDVETGDTWLFRNKKTYSPYTATTAFKIEGNGNITANGTVTATGGNSTNWNTAYGWGNHASAGYFSAGNKPAVADITGLIEGTSFSGTYPIVFNIGGANRLFSEDSITFTGATNTLNINGNTAWHAGNDGSGSGLDADLLDGQQGSYYYSAANPPPTYSKYLRSDTSDTMSGTLSLEGNLLLTGSATTSNQSRMIDFTGFDKEGTTDTTDRAYIAHTTNTGGHSGSALVISSQNDANDGIAFATNSSSQLKHNGKNIGTQSVVTTAPTSASGFPNGHVWYVVS